MTSENAKLSMQEEPKTITFVYPQMVMGGAEKALIRMLRAIDPKRLKANVILLKHGGELENELASIVPVDYCEEITLGESLRKLRVGELIKGVYCRIRIRMARTYEEKSLWTSRVYRVPETISKDCVAVYSHYNFLSICIAAQSEAKKKIFWVHMGFRENMNRRLYEKVLSNFDTVYCVGEGVKRSFDSLFPQYSNRSSVFHNVVDVGEIREKAQEEISEELMHPAIVTVARLSEEKGLRMVPDVVQKLWNTGCPVYWYLVGEGPLRPELEEAIDEKEITGKLVLLGNRENPFPYMNRCDIYVQPSLDEGYCTTTVEAKVLCKPIVATKIMGMAEQFENNVTGVLVEPTIENILTGAEQLIADEKFCDALVDRLSLEYTKNFSGVEKLYLE